MRTLRLALCVAALTAAAAPTMAYAQDWSFIGETNALLASSMVQTNILNEVVHERVDRQTGGKRGCYHSRWCTEDGKPFSNRAGKEGSQTASQLVLQGQAAQQAAAVPTRFTPDPVVSRKVQGQLIVAFRKQDPGSADHFARTLASGDVIDAYARTVAPFGLDARDALDALTAYWVMQWMLANNSQQPPSRTQVQAVRAQLARNLDGATAARFGSEAFRQEFGETLIYQFMMMDAARSQLMRKGDAQQLRQMAEMARDGGRKGLGVDLGNLILTDQGFRSRG